MKKFILPFCLAFLLSCDDTLDFILKQEVAISTIKVEFIPQTNNGLPWDDDASKPDVGYVLLNDQQKVLLQSIDPIEGDASDLPLGLQVTFGVLPSVDHNYTLLIVDFDDNLAYQIMGSKTFNLNNVKDNLPELIRITSGDLKAVLALHWGPR